MKYLLYVLIIIVEYLFLLVGLLFFCDPFNTSYGNGYYVSSDTDYGQDDLIYDCLDNDSGNRMICFHDTLGNIDTLFIPNNRTSEGVLSRHVSPIDSDDKYIILQRKPRSEFDSLFLNALNSDSLAYIGLVPDCDYSFRYLYNNTQFWIVDKQSNDIYGPLTKSQYEVYRKKLNISDWLRFPYEDEWLKVKQFLFVFKIFLVFLSPLFVFVVFLIIYKKVNNNQGI